jgi:hypothetical protein
MTPTTNAPRATPRFATHAISPSAIMTPTTNVQRATPRFTVPSVPARDRLGEEAPGFPQFAAPRSFPRPGALLIRLMAKFFWEAKSDCTWAGCSSERRRAIFWHARLVLYLD